MKNYKENDVVIYTDKNGNSFDTFVIFDTDRNTGLTHINHENLNVSADSLKLHSYSLTGNQAPLADALSFLLYNKLKEKYTLLDDHKTTLKQVVNSRIMPPDTGKLAKAS